MSLSYTASTTPLPADFVAAKAALDKISGQLPETISSVGRPRAFLHDQPTEHVFVLLHGLTNVPGQFEKLGRILFERGNNVLIPLTPGHGESDMMTDKLAHLTGQNMLDSANEAITIARALGRHVTVAGLSVNGATAAWVAQNRSDVDRVVLLAPFLGPFGVPHWAVRPLGRLLVRVPNAFIWWDPIARANVPHPPYAYPRFSTRSLGQTMLLGQEVFQAARTTPPACGSILLVTTASDRAANNADAMVLAAAWKTHRPDAVATYEFPKTDAVPHDFIDPSQSNQRVDLVYPRLIEMLVSGRPPGGS